MRVRAAFALAIWLALAGASLAACPPPVSFPNQEAVAQGMARAQDRGFLWRITKGDRSSYLYGTIHVAREAWMYPGPRLRGVLGKVDALALELDPMDPDTQKKIQTAMKAREGEVLPAGMLGGVRKVAATECVPFELIDGLSPMGQLLVLAVLATRVEGLEPAYGIDMLLAGWAHGAKKPLTSLETAELQIRMLFPPPEDAEEAYRETFKELESGNAAKIQMRLANAWAMSDFAELSGYRDWCQCADTPVQRKEMERMLDLRNPPMAERIDALHASGATALIAVGSLHMVGPNGLPQLLEQKGYRVERMGAQP